MLSMVEHMDVPWGQQAAQRTGAARALSSCGGALWMGWPQALLSAMAGYGPGASFLAFPGNTEVQPCHSAPELLRTLSVYFITPVHTGTCSPKLRYLRKEQEENNTTRFESLTFQHL